MIRRMLSLAAAAVFACGAAQAQTVRIAYIDPLTGPAASIADNSLRTLQTAVRIANENNWANGRKLELVPLDGRGSPQESLLQLKSATDKGIQFVVQSLGSNVALALLEAINKHNERNPGKEVLYLDPNNTTPELTNEKCSFWYFRFDSHVLLKTNALVSHLVSEGKARKVYLINQNYAMGQQVSTAVKEELKRRKSSIEIVGDDLHPMLQVKDFAPYVSKIKASGADAVITANWSLDFTLLMKSAKDASLKVPFYTLNAGSHGIPAAMGAAGIENVSLVSWWNPNDNPQALNDIVFPFQKQYGDDFFAATYYTTIAFLAKAIAVADSTDPSKVALALEGMRLKSLNGEVEMRKADHQLAQPLFINQWTRVDGKAVKYDQEKSGFGWKTIRRIPLEDTEIVTSCRMQRPGY